jgi:hypothetical protein
MIKKILPVIVLSFIPLTGCSNNNNNAEISETASPVVLLSAEEKLQLQFCNLVEKAFESYENSGMSYETRDIFGEAYDVNKKLIGEFYSSRYSDYNWVMSAHSYAYGPLSEINEVVEILGWCKDTITLLEKKSAE